MKAVKLLLTICLILGALSSVSAQNFLLDPLFEDSAKCIVAAKPDTVWQPAEPYKEVMFPKGMEIESCGPAHSSYIAFEHEGKHYVVFKPSVKFSENNPEGTVNPLSEEQIMRHGKTGHFYATYAPAVMVVLLLILVLLSYGLTLVSKKLAPIALVVMSLSLLLVTVFEVVGLWTLGSDAFWWCDSDKFGFFGALFRLIPFAMVVALQFYSIKLFERVLFIDSPEETDSKISLKPAAIGLVAFLPIMFAYFAIVQQWIGWQGKASDTVVGILAFGTLVIGILISFRKNISTMGAFKGFAISLFSIIYLLGLLAAIWGMIVVLFKLIIQVIMVIGAIVILAMLTKKTYYRGSDGHIYSETGVGGMRRES